MYISLKTLFELQNGADFLIIQLMENEIGILEFILKFIEMGYF